MPIIQEPPATGSIPIVPVRSWKQRLLDIWLYIPEPRIVSLLTGFAYTIFLLTGVVTLTLPPTSIEASYGPAVMQMVGYFFIGGALVGIVGGTTDFWQLERVGIVGMAVGLATYLYIVITLQVAAESGNRYTQMGVIVISLILLAKRLAGIWRYNYKPRG